MDDCFGKSRRRFLAAFAGASALASAQSSTANTGVEIGDAIPVLEAPDQDGRMRSFDDLKGPNGLLLLFHRSADW